MGQQQLLLVILVTIIVGIATVVAINTFGTAADQANIDAVNNDIATLASAAQGYFIRPEMLGGGGRDFTDLTFASLSFPASGIDEDGEIAENENGRYVISGAAGDEFTITAHPASCEGYTPGNTDGDENGDGAGVLSPGSDCSSGDETITALVGPNTFNLNP